MTELTSQATSALANAANRYHAQIAAALDLELAHRPPPTITTGDCAAAWALLDRGLAASPQIADALDKGGSLIIVEVPGWEWLRPTRETLKAHLDGFVEMDDTYFNKMMDALSAGDDEEISPPAEPDEAARPVWAWFSGSKDKPWTDLEIDSMTKALNGGKGVIVLTARQDSLPVSIKLAADHHLLLSRPDGAAMSVAGHVLAGHHPTTTISDELCNYLTPDLLCLCHRVGEDGNGWLRRLGTLASLASKSVQYEGPALADLHGMDEAKHWGLSLERDLKEYLAGRLHWRDVDKGCLLVGPSGTGKTSYARILAGTAGLPLVMGSHSEWQAGGHLGQMLAAMRATFERARVLAPCILFIDEVDAFPDRRSLRSSHRDYGIQVVNALLEATDGTLSREGVILVAAANSLEVDPALLRPGRLDRVIMVSHPDDTALARILRQHLGEEHLPGVDLFPYVKGMTASGAEAELWARSARREARRAGRPMSIEDLAGQIPRPPDLPDDLARRIATHEAGHAVLTSIELPGHIQRVQMQRENPGMFFTPGRTFTQEEIRLHIRILLAGRAAEELLLSAVSTGAGGPPHSDLAQATTLATSMLLSHGLGETLYWAGDVDPSNVSAHLVRNADLAAKVDRILNIEYEKARALLGINITAIEKIADMLMERETLEGHEVEKVVNEMMREAKAVT